MRRDFAMRIRRWVPVPGSAALALALALAPGAGFAQTPSQLIVITEPQDWQDGRAIVVPSGGSLRIVGWATHPSGVSRVLVDGTPARLQTDASGLVKFDAVVTAGATTKEVVVVVEPKASRPFSRTFSLGVGSPGRAEPAPAAPAAPVAPVSRAGLGDTAAAVPGTPPAGTPAATGTPSADTSRAAAPSNVPRMVMADPWKPFAFRGAGYAVLAAGGLYLATKQTSSTSEVCTTSAAGLDCVNRTETKKSFATVGMGLVGAAAVGGIVDGLLTSRRATAAKSELRQGNAGSDAGVHLGRAGVAPDAHGRVTALVEFRF